MVIRKDKVIEALRAGSHIYFSIHSISPELISRVGQFRGTVNLCTFHDLQDAGIIRQNPINRCVYDLKAK